MISRLDDEPQQPYIDYFIKNIYKCTGTVFLDNQEQTDQANGLKVLKQDCQSGEIKKENYFIGCIQTNGHSDDEIKTNISATLGSPISLENIVLVASSDKSIYKVYLNPDAVTKVAQRKFNVLYKIQPNNLSDDNEETNNLFKGLNDRSKALFEKIAVIIENNSLSEDPNTKILIDRDKRIIYFGHSLVEITASYPQVVGPLMGWGKPLQEENFNTATLNIETCGEPIKYQQRDLISEAEKYFNESLKKTQTQEKKTIPSLSSSPDEALLSLVSENRGIVIGEVHDDPSPKALLIKNMESLKKQGVTTLFFEHLLIEAHSEALNEYFKPETKQMPSMLKDYLAYLDKGFNAYPPNTYTNLIMKAKECGIKVIPIDTVVSYSLKPMNEKEQQQRNLMMNYIAAQQLTKYLENPNEKDGKYLVFCGSSHINMYDTGVPGITELTGSPTVVIEEIKEKNCYLYKTKQPEPVLGKMLGDEFGAEYILSNDALYYLNKSKTVSQQDLITSDPEIIKILWKNFSTFKDWHGDNREKIGPPEQKQIASISHFQLINHHIAQPDVLIRLNLTQKTEPEISQRLDREKMSVKKDDANILKVTRADNKKPLKVTRADNKKTLVRSPRMWASKEVKQVNDTKMESESKPLPGRNNK